VKYFTNPDAEERLSGGDVPGAAGTSAASEERTVRVERVLHIRDADERRLAYGAVAALAVLAVPVALVAGLAAGWPGAVSALLGLSFVLVLFGASASLLAWVARRRHDRAIAVLVGGAVGRLLFYLVALLVLAQFGWVHRVSLALATGVAVAVTLAFELVLLSRMPHLFWIDAGAARTTAVPHATRSESL
jgi:hypothetical protein